MEKLWTTGEVARFLGVEEIDVEDLVKQGKLVGYKLGGQFLRFRPDEVEALKGAIQPQRPVGRSATAPRRTWYASMREFIYFYDFYLVSATCLAVLVVYLIAAG